MMKILMQMWSAVSKLTEEKAAALQQNQKLRQELVFHLGLNVIFFIFKFSYSTYSSALISFYDCVWEEILPVCHGIRNCEYFSFYKI